MINAEQLSDQFTDARKQWREQHEQDATHWSEAFVGECRGCHKMAALAQHWNDVGGRDSLECEMCWVESIMCFWASEDEAEQLNKIRRINEEAMAKLRDMR